MIFKTYSQNPRRLLDPMDRISEVLFALIMVLSFTLSISYAEEGRAGIRAMLIGAVGCNLAWGIIDAIMYLMACLGERGQGMLSLRKVRRAASAGEAQRTIAEALPEVVAAVLQPEEFEAIHQRLNRLPEPPAQTRLQKDDWLGAFAVFLWVLLSTFPVVLPFLFVSDPARALRISNIVAVSMLFLTGYSFGRVVGYRPWVLGLSMILLGTTLVGITIALGG